MNLPEPDSHPLDAFLHQFEKDNDAGTVRRLHEYIAMFPEADDAIAYLREESASEPRGVQK